MKILIWVAVAVVLLLVLACCKVAGDCDKEEERRFHQRCRERADANRTERETENEQD